MDSLSDKRKELYMKLCSSEGINKVLPLASIFAQIEEQDKEAVEELKKKLKVSGHYDRELLWVLKEIFGDKLCGDGK